MNDHYIIEAMQRFGGSFVKALALAFVHADDTNRERIKVAFPDLWAEYEDLARLWAEKQAKETA